jgi:hypothetical protein
MVIPNEFEDKDLTQCRATFPASSPAGVISRSPGERSDTRDRGPHLPAYRCAHAGYALGHDATPHFQRHHRADAQRRDPVIQLQKPHIFAVSKLGCRVKPGNDAAVKMRFTN